MHQLRLEQCGDALIELEAALEAANDRVAELEVCWVPDGVMLVECDVQAEVSRHEENAKRHEETMIKHINKTVALELEIQSIKAEDAATAKDEVLLCVTWIQR